METKKILRILNLKAIFSVMYLVMAVAFIFAYLHFRNYDYEYGDKSLVVIIGTMLRHGLGLVILTSSIYFWHFIFGSFIYPHMYKRAIKMDNHLIIHDGSWFRGMLICLMWSIVFIFGFYDIIPTLTICVVVTVWVLFHIVLMFLTRTSKLFTLTKETVDLLTLFPEGCQNVANLFDYYVYFDFYFFTPNGVDKDDWRQRNIESLIKRRQLLIDKEIAKSKELSKKVAQTPNQ